MRAYNRVFAIWRLLLYYVILWLLIFVGAYMDEMACKLNNHFISTVVVNIMFMISNAFCLIQIIIPLCCYSSVIKKMRDYIRAQTEGLKISEESSSETEADKLSYYSSSWSSLILRDEKRFVASIRVYACLLVIIISLKYMSYLTMFLTYVYTRSTDHSTLYILHQCSTSLLYTFYVFSNIVLFYINDAEFQLRILRSLRYVIGSRKKASLDG